MPPRDSQTLQWTGPGPTVLVSPPVQDEAATPYSFTQSQNVGPACRTSHPPAGLARPIAMISATMSSIRTIDVFMDGVAQDQEKLVAPGEVIRKLGEGTKFTEGPAWIPAKKSLIFSDIPND